jgi:hypothetical protein
LVLGSPDPADLGGMKDRIAAIESAAKTLPGDVSALGARIGAIQPKLDALGKDMETLGARLNGFAARDQLGAANARFAAASLLEEAIARARPLSGSIDLLKNLGVAPTLLAPLGPFAEAGIPNARKLADELKSAIASSRSTPASPSVDPNASFFDRIKNSAASLVEIRRTGDPGGSDDASLLLRAEQALQRDDLASALTATAKISTETALAYAGWRQRVETVLKAREAAAAIRADAFANLAKIAAAAK